MSGTAETTIQPPAKPLKKRLEAATTNLLLLAIIVFCTLVIVHSVKVILNRHNNQPRQPIAEFHGGSLK